MDTPVSFGLFKLWRNDWKTFDTSRSARDRRPSPHLGIGAGLVVTFVSSFFSAHAADALAVIVGYGPHAYFHDRLRIADWKHGVLSNGFYLNIPAWLLHGPFGFLLWVASILVADFFAMAIQGFIRRNGRWADVSFRLVGGAALLGFAGSLYRQGDWGLHPIPLSALIGGLVLVWRGMASMFRHGQPQA